MTAKIIADSISPDGIRLTTMQLRYPKFIHGEFMTHRVFSRNASSSRAIPVERLIADVMDDPAMPIHWGKNQKGMQADEEHNSTVELVDTLWCNQYGYAPRDKAWLLARDQAVDMARAFTQAGYHKQIVNRLLEPFCYINVVVTATEWSNFFALRDHAGAQPEIQVLAREMKAAMEMSSPNPLRPGEWHLPYAEDAVTTYQCEEYVATAPDMDPASLARKVSVARCARVSYLTQEGKRPSVAEDLALYDRLLASVPLHASPAEHQATPDERVVDGGKTCWLSSAEHGNLNGWIQYRKTLQGECQ